MDGRKTVKGIAEIKDNQTETRKKAENANTVFEGAGNISGQKPEKEKIEKIDTSKSGKDIPDNTVNQIEHREKDDDGKKKDTGIKENDGKTTLEGKTDISSKQNAKLDEEKMDHAKIIKDIADNNHGKKEDDGKTTFEGQDTISGKNSLNKMDEKLDPSKTDKDIAEKKINHMENGKQQDGGKTYSDGQENISGNKFGPIKMHKTNTGDNFTVNKDNQKEHGSRENDGKTTLEGQANISGKKYAEREEEKMDQTKTDKNAVEKKENRKDGKEQDDGHKQNPEKTTFQGQNSIANKMSETEYKEISKNIEKKNLSGERKIKEKTESKYNLKGEVEMPETDQNLLKSKSENYNSKSLSKPHTENSGKSQDDNNNTTDVTKVSSDTDLKKSQAYEEVGKPRSDKEYADKKSTNSVIKFGSKEVSTNMVENNNSSVVKEPQNDHEKKILEKEMKLQALKARESLPDKNSKSDKNELTKTENNENGNSAESGRKSTNNFKQEGRAQSDEIKYNSDGKKKEKEDKNTAINEAKGIISSYKETEEIDKGKELDRNITKNSDYEKQKKDEKHRKLYHIPSSLQKSEVFQSGT